MRKNGHDGAAGERLFEQFSRIGQALSSARRLELIDLLRQCEKDVETLARHTGMSVANTSRHLQQLKGCGLVEFRKEGVRCVYRLAQPEVYELYRNLRKVAGAQISDVDRIVDELLGDAASAAPPDRQDLLRRAEAGEILILDVRPEDEFAAGHLPAALSLPLSRLKDELPSLPRDKEVVAYCRGPYCILAAKAVKVLQEAGLRASRLGEGIVEWEAAGMPLEKDTRNKVS